MKTTPIIAGLLFATSCGGFVNTVFSSTERTGNERIIYNDAETGRIIWRMTVSDMNDKHCYYSYQPWNEDMTKIIWSSAVPETKSGAIWVMDADGGNFIKVMDDVPYNMHTGVNAKWSPDGRHIYWGETDACDMDGNRVKRPAEEDYVRNKDEYRQGPVHVTNPMCYELSPHKKLLDERPGAVRNPKWSPDKKTLLIGFSNEYEDPETYKQTPPTVKELYLIDADGTNFRRLNDFGHHHSWSPDSKSIIYCGQNSEGLVLEAIDGSSRRVVCKTTGVHPSLNPQGTLVVTDSYGGEYTDYLLLIHMEDGRVEKLCKTPRTHPRSHGWTHVHPTWSPDGSMVMYDSDESGVCQVYVIVIDEAKVRTRYGDSALQLTASR